MTFNPKATLDQRQKAVAALVEELKADTRPIVLGPFRSELGFESSYWLPFLTALAKKVPDFQKRAVVVTRGGVAPLYKAVASRGVDLYQLRTVTEVRRENLYDAEVTHKGIIKQLSRTPWDDAVVDDVSSQLRLGMPHVLHPALMYWALAPYWEERAGMKYLTSLCDFTPIEKPGLPEGCPLPPAYLAVKFYARATFPFPHPDTVEFVQKTVGVLAAQLPVVVLMSHDTHDDHTDIAITGTNVTQSPEVAPEQNLLAQVAILAHAKAFIGNYGGMAQTALRMGVPSVSVYQIWGGTAHAHLSLQSWISKATHVPFAVGSLDDARLWAQAAHVPKAATTLPVAVTA